MKHARFRLTGATKVSRLHKGDMQPPMMRGMQNFYVSRSDNLPTLVGDLVRFRDDIYAFSSATAGMTTDSTDYLNTVIDTLAPADPIYITRLAPFHFVGTTATLIAGTYTTGTVTTTGLNSTVEGAGTAFLQNAWKGCFIKISTSSYYRVASVVSDTVLTVEGTPAAYAGLTYSILQTHDCTRANYPVHVEKFGDYSIYSATSPSEYDDTETICGPFQCDTVVAAVAEYFTSISSAPAGAGKGCYDGTRYVYFPDSGTHNTYYQVDTTTNTVVTKTFATTPTGDFHPRAITTNGTLFIVAGDDDGECCIYSSTTPGTSNSWVWRAGLYVGRYNDVTWDGEQFFAVGTNTTPAPDEVVTAYSSNGTSWTQATGSGTGWTGTTATACTGNGNDSSDFACFINSASDVYYAAGDSINDSTGGGVSLTGTCVDVSYSSTLGKFLTGDNTTLKSNATPSGAWTTLGTMGGAIRTVEYDSTGGVYWCGAASGAVYKTASGVSYTTVTGSGGGNMDSIVVAGSNVYVDDGADIWVYVAAVPAHFGVTGNFAPLSTDYRGTGFVVVGAYLVLLGTREFSTPTWTYYPQRIRWAVPGGSTDFTSAGAGYQDLDPAGVLIDGRTIGNTAVLLESNKMSALDLTGDTTAPFNYRIIKDRFRALSNLLKVENAVYVLGSDGLLYMTNGVTVDPFQTAFDASEYDDFDYTAPYQLGYDDEIRSILVFRPTATGDHIVYTISLESGSVGEVYLPTIESWAVTGYSVDNYPRSIVQVIAATGVTGSDPSYPTL